MLVERGSERSQRSPDASGLPVPRNARARRAAGDRAPAPGWLAKALASAACLAALVGVTACGGTTATSATAPSPSPSETPSGSSTPRATLTYADSSVFCQNLSPLAGSLEAKRAIAYESLLTFTSYDKPFTSGVLSSWNVSDGNKVMTMTIKPNIQFSDGSPLDAQAVKTWLDWRAAQASALYGNTFMGKIKSVQATGKYDVRITLENPNPRFEFALSQAGLNWGTVASPKAVAAAKANPNSSVFTKATYGFGPYMLDRTQTVQGDHCTYVPNPHYYDKSKIKWAKLVTKRLANPTAQLAAVQTGQVDVLQGAPNAQSAAAAAGYSVLKAPAFVLTLGLRDHGGLNPALKDVRVRQALNYALDRATIAKSLWPNAVTPTSSPNPGADGDDPKYVNLYDYDPAKAKSLLAAAGYGSGFTLKVLSGQGGFGFDLDKLGAAACEYWKKVGVRCDIRTIPPAAYGPAYVKKDYSMTPGVDLVYPTWSWFGAYELPASPRADLFGWSDPEGIALYKKASVATGPAAADAAKAVLNRAIEQAYTIPVGTYPLVLIANKKVGGIAARDTTLLTDWYPAGK